MNVEIDITGADLPLLVKTAYDLSRPYGLGWFHYQPGTLTEGEIQNLVRPNKDTPINIDYVKGRTVKLLVTKRNGRLLMPGRWREHSPDDLWELLVTVGTAAPFDGSQTA